MTPEIDTDTPVDSALVVADDSKLIYTHGGVATKIAFDKVTVEPAAQLLQRGITLAENKVTMLRLDHEARMQLIAPEIAITYEGCSFSDVPLHKLADNIKTTEDRVFIPDIPFPIIAYIENARLSSKCITVSLPSHEFDFVDTTLGIAEPIHLYMPPLWFGIETSGTNVTKYKVAVVPEYNGNAETTRLKALPLPNIYSDGHICMGSSRLLSASTSDTDGARLANAIARFFNSSWNGDLCGSNASCAGKEQVTKLAATKPETAELLTRAMKNLSSQHVGTLCAVAAFARPGGWLDVKYNHIDVSTREFLSCDNR